MSPITSHVLDTRKGRPAQGVEALLERYKPNQHWERLATGTTNADGRIPDLLPAGSLLEAGIYRITFETGAYFEKDGIQGFYPRVPITFEILAPEEHYHIPLLLSPFGYSTYRGS